MCRGGQAKQVQGYIADREPAVKDLSEQKIADALCKFGVRIRRNWRLRTAQQFDAFSCHNSTWILRLMRGATTPLEVNHLARGQDVGVADWATQPCLRTSANSDAGRAPSGPMRARVVLNSWQAKLTSVPAASTAFRRRRSGSALVPDRDGADLSPKVSDGSTVPKAKRPLLLHQSGPLVALKAVEAL